MIDLRAFIRDVPDFPAAGIVFKDITPLLADGPAFAETIALMSEAIAGVEPTMIVGIESRGFIFGAPIAARLGVGFVPVRKFGKLPWRTFTQSYDLEYGTDTLEIHEDAFKPAARVIVADDLLATGGTMAAVVDLVQDLGAEVIECTFMAELEFLHGRQRLPDGKVYSLLKF
jgi:adenine phosphoribosyltransferase